MTRSFIHETEKASIDDENEVIKISFIHNPILGAFFERIMSEFKGFFFPIMEKFYGLKIYVLFRIFFIASPNLCFLGIAIKKLVELIELSEINLFL